MENSIFRKKSIERVSSPEQVRADCGVSRDGSNARNILRAARSYGLEAKGYRVEPEDLRQDACFPCIVHWNFNHFVVLCGFKGGNAIINDPARGKCSVSMAAFDKAFTGVCLCLSQRTPSCPADVRKVCCPLHGSVWWAPEPPLPL